MSLDLTSPPRVTGHLLLFRKTDWATSGLSHDEVRDVMARVNVWFDELSAAGKVVSAQPLMESGVLIAGSTVTDGPFAETKEVVGGYVLLSVDSLEEAVGIAKANPMTEVGLITEVRPTASTCPYLQRIFGEPAAAAFA